MLMHFSRYGEVTSISLLPLQVEEFVNLLWFGVKSGSETNHVCMDTLKTAINIIVCAFAQAD